MLFNSGLFWPRRSVIRRPGTIVVEILDPIPPRLPKADLLRRLETAIAWETFALIPIFRDPALLMKRELFWIPFHGWFSYKFQMIPVDQDLGPSALRRMLREARKRIEDGREIIIFPEGTRRAPGAPPDYKTGIVLLYDALSVPCLPVALNSGLFWPRRSVIRRPGTIIVEILDPIPPGLPKAEFLRRLETAIEGGFKSTACGSGRVGARASIFG